LHLQETSLSSEWFLRQLQSPAQFFVLNTIVAEELCQIADRLEKAEDLNAGNSRSSQGNSKKTTKE